jgi:hypothetical protein
MIKRVNNGYLIIMVMEIIRRKMWKMWNRKKDNKK